MSEATYKTTCDLLAALGRFGAYSMNEEGELGDFHLNPLAAEAIVVITDLQKQLENARTGKALLDLERMTEHRDLLLATGDSIVGCIKMQMWETLDLMIKEWEEARRG